MSIGSNGDIVVADSTPADVTYSEVLNSGTSCVYSDRTREIGVPRSISISHQTVGKGDALRLRSMVKLQDSIENSTVEGDVVTGSLHVVYDIPQRVYEKADVTNLQAQLVNLIGSTNFVDKILNQEV